MAIRVGMNTVGRTCMYIRRARGWLLRGRFIAALTRACVSLHHGSRDAMMRTHSSSHGLAHPGRRRNPAQLSKLHRVAPCGSAVATPTAPEGMTA